MRYPLLLLAAGLLVLPSCKHQRTVTAGPTNIDLGVNDYDPNESAKNEAVMQEAARTGATMTGNTGGGEGFSSRFGSMNPHGYGKNAMQDKMFGGLGDSKKPTKMFSQTKSFLTRKFNSGKEGKDVDKKLFNGTKSSNWEDKLFSTDEAPDGDVAFRDSDKRMPWTQNRDAGKMAAVKNYRDGNKTMATGSYYPAEKAMTSSRTDAKAKNADGSEAGKVMGLINGGGDNRATESDIRALLGKP